MIDASLRSGMIALLAFTGVSAVSGPVLAARVQPTADLAELYRRGGAAFDAADYDRAIEAFGEGVAESGRRGDMRMRAYFMVSLAIAHTRAFALDRDRGHLARGKDLLTRVLADEPGHLDAASRAKAVDGLAEIDREWKASEPPPTPAPSPDGPRTAFGTANPNAFDTASRDALGTDRSEAPARTDPRSPHARRRTVAIALVATGAAATLGGLAGILYAAIVPGVLEGRVEADNQRAYLDEHAPRVRAIWYGVGGALTAAGVGLVAAGTTMLVRGRREVPTARIQLGPALGTWFGGRVHVAF